MKQTGLILTACACLLTAPLHALAAEPTQTVRLAQGPAQADGRIDVIVLEASNADGGIDPGLEHLPHLRRMPFAAYRRIRKVGDRSSVLTTTPTTVALPDGNSAVIVSRGRRPNGKLQVSVELTVHGTTSNVQFAAAPGDPFFTVRAGSDKALIFVFVVH